MSVLGGVWIADGQGLVMTKIQRPPNMHQTPEPVRILSWEWTTGISEGDGVTSRHTIQEWEVRLSLPSIRRIYRSIQDVHSKRLCTPRTFLSQVYEHDKQDVCDTLLQEFGVVLFSVEIYRHPSVIIAEKWWDGRGWGRCPTKERLLDTKWRGENVRFLGVYLVYFRPPFLDTRYSGLMRPWERYSRFPD